MSIGDIGLYHVIVFPHAGVVQVKDLTLSSDIALHDLDTKLKQVTSWLEKKYHVRLTLRPRREQSAQPLVISHTHRPYYNFILKIKTPTMTTIITDD